MDRHSHLYTAGSNSQPATPRNGNPEDFYRSSPEPLPPTDPHLYNVDANGVSPTDSQAPIMSRQSTGPYEAYPPGTAETTGVHQDAQQQHPPPSIPEGTHAVYRQSLGIGVVNGEFGASAGPAPSPYTPVSPVSPNHGEFRFPAAPLSAGLKTPATIKEEDRVVELEEKARQEDQKDLAIKLKVRLAKVVLRSIHCCCSLVVLALVASTFAIFYATRHLPKRNNLPPWSSSTPQWPQITILVIACVSLLLSLTIMYGYWKGGHNRAEKAAFHATIFAGAVFIFTIVMWSCAIAVMQGSRQKSNGQDIWGWACKDNTRRHLFDDKINYTLVCRQQDWVVICAIIEISVEFLAICLYIFAFYRIFVSKRRLRKSLHLRDEARSSLWLAKLREQRGLEEGMQDPETDKNTAYNQLTSNAAYAEPPS